MRERFYYRMRLLRYRTNFTYETVSRQFLTLTNGAFNHYGSTPACHAFIESGVTQSKQHRQIYSVNTYGNVIHTNICRPFKSKPDN